MDYMMSRLAADHRATLLDEAAAYRRGKEAREAKAAEPGQSRRSRRSSGRHQLSRR